MPLPRRSSAKALALSRTAPRRDLFEDEARFLRSWFERPLVTGAVTPSGRLLARTMASYVDPRLPGPVIELGPGTGPVTDALVRRGIEQERLVLVEYNPDFCELLRRRFPRATILRGDAYRMRETLRDIVTEPACATISSLPLFTKPLERRLDLLQEAHDLMQPNAPFVQFTYAVVPPIPARSSDYTASRSNKVWLNLPPARVWVYRRP
ncbi:class I SAM-dependent methyltransferase [Methylobacterium nodulans]|uniref:Phospholipid N-methyltransferase n=1 Tax=Methylobacterium nodulans (strain LMG 21967 / CNCM I-2342 / ORS 2060) TaxID=460265 RepID=B8IHL1_METNO|nr:phospholipid N-methyltransferase [Methylobacterium nodulans]ACL61674.1 phospholipid N-methyltransferase [Methylobacterium nodulans ORS 2060]